MVLKHIRHVVTVHGDKRPYLGNENYYNSIPIIAKQLTDEMEIPSSFKSGLHRDQTSAICEISSLSKEYAERLAEELRKLNLYEKIEVTTEEIDIEKMARDRGVDPGDITDLLES